MAKTIEDIRRIIVDSRRQVKYADGNGKSHYMPGVYFDSPRITVFNRYAMSTWDTDDDTGNFSFEAHEELDEHRSMVVLHLLRKSRDATKLIRQGLSVEDAVDRAFPSLEIVKLESAPPKSQMNVVDDTTKFYRNEITPPSDTHRIPRVFDSVHRIDESK